MTEYPRFDHFDEFYVWRDFYLASFLLPISGDPKRAEHELIKQMLRFELDPLAAALYIWDWGHDELTGCRLENWKIEAFCRLRDHLTTPKTRHQPFKLAIASGHGIGKSAFLSMLNIVMLSTFPGTRIFNTANTEGQLLNKTWPEVSKWHKTAITSHWFVYTATALSTHGDDSKNWRSDAITWSLSNTAAFAGAHNQKKRLVECFDESSQIPQQIYDVVEGAMSDADTQLIWISFGNMTMNSGAFYDLFFSPKSRWHTQHIDSRDVSITNKTYLNELVDTHGEDSDFVRVRVRGLPPRSSLCAAIPDEWIAPARNKIFNHPSQYNFAPAIVGIDGAWTGDDPLEVYFRQGNFCKHVITIPCNNDDFKTTSLIVQAVKNIHPGKIDAWILDQGYGTGIYSALRSINIKNAYLIPFGGSAPELGYANMRTWIWSEMGKWCRDGGSISGDVQLELELGQPEMHTVMTGKRAGWKILESKRDMAVRGVKSPNRGDALAVTFALPISNSDNSYEIKVMNRNPGKEKKHSFSGLI